MAKPRSFFKLALPSFDNVKPWKWYSWRKRVWRELQKSEHIRFGRAKVELRVWGYLPQRMDIDNCLKNIIDALQGAIGGSKPNRKKRFKIIENDNQVYRVVIQKKDPKRGKSIYIEVRRFNATKFQE